MGFFPDPLALESDKFKNGKQWFKDWLDTAQFVSRNREKQVYDIDRNMNRFAGNMLSDYDHLNYTAGRPNLHIIKNNHFASAKMYLLMGEMLEKPMNATVYSVNPSAKAEKFDRLAEMTGLYHSQEQRKKVFETTGIDMFKDKPVPKENPMGQAGMMNTRLQHENIMQLVLNGLIDKGNVKSKIFRDFKHLLLGSECFGQVTYNEYSKIPRYHSIDIRNSLFVEMDDDPFLERTPLIGARRRMTFQEILDTYELDDQQLNELRSIRDTASNGTLYNTFKHNFYEYDDNRGVLFWVTDIEFRAESPLYYKISQDNYGNTHTKLFYEPKTFEDEWNVHAKKAEAGKYSVGRKYKTFVYTATLIGQTIYTNMGRKKYAIGNFESPSEAMYSYTGLNFNTTAGTRLSLYGMLENLAELHDVIVGQITREIKKAKGKAVTFDRAYLKKGGTAKGMLYDLVNHGIVEVNSAADGNEYGVDMTQTQKLGLNEVDISASVLVQQLVSMLDVIDRMGDRITGINENREGMPKASQTATAGNNAVTASRSITYPRNFFFDKMTENIFGRLIEYGKLAIFDNPEFFINLIGPEGVAYIHSLKDIPFNSYWTYLGDPGKEMNIRQMMRNYFPQAVNAGEMRPMDAMRFELAETMAEALNVLEEGWEKIKEIEQRRIEAEQNQKETSEQRAERMETEKREDEQLHAMVLEILKGKTKSGVDMRNILKDLVMQEKEIQQESQASAR